MTSKVKCKETHPECKIPNNNIISQRDENLSKYPTQLC